ncbi:hypothetical protein ASG49_05125 [Marmoricola sp. Leaf446]|uniref:DUF1707 SHOCT-like domain-containing protein n=1 Tax=Marmoricola sp. Leaf446 TaxID=1736379 RepID=UPI0006FF6019|nr:DUF1707 domain-containing protein [Marmoricola sp. Leaf446]KQT94278.1 hypothetical protein ASG49_05125 [Marmoricola sp. Leaf446]
MAELRIGDGERESAVAALGEHYAQGRLTKDEYDERSDAAWTARTAGDLRPLFADLPASAAGPVAPRPGAGEVVAPPPRRQVPWKALLVALAVLGVLTNGKLVLVALLLWFVLARHHRVPHPPWVHRGPGATPPPPWGSGGGHRR